MNVTGGQKLQTGRRHRHAGAQAEEAFYTIEKLGGK